MHQAAGLVEVHSIRCEAVEQVYMQKQLLVSFHHEGTELQDGSDVLARLPVQGGMKGNKNAIDLKS